MKEQERGNSSVLRSTFYIVMTIIAGYVIFLMTNRQVSVRLIEACAWACESKTSQIKKVTRSSCECEDKVKKATWALSPNKVEWVTPKLLPVKKKDCKTCK